ncbi:hypothetical protein POM88_013936 [Heracleum sosnowskyi]|uniref:Uncharacterized protein n=1 Tax=Heracleum sosnowskyi TaxID=360622 RepID=A0AAD8IZH8_9APIA|nr:hypothetical protein POM88_013936 [Heracleum sosnowskyi]
MNDCEFVTDMHFCVAYGVCNIAKKPSCGWKDWKAGGWSGGCVWRTALACGHGHKFIPHVGQKMPDTRLYSSIAIRGCGVECLMWLNEMLNIKGLQGIWDKSLRRNFCLRIRGKQSLEKKEETGDHTHSCIVRIAVTSKNNVQVEAISSRGKASSKVGAGLTMECQRFTRDSTSTCSCRKLSALLVQKNSQV